MMSSSFLIGFATGAISVGNWIGCLLGLLLGDSWIGYLLDLHLGVFSARGSDGRGMS